MTTLRYMLDTTVISDIIRDPQGATARQIGVVGERRLCLSAIVASEARFGARKRGSRRLTAQVDAVLGRLPIIPYDDAAARSYGDVRHDLEQRGLPIGATDLFIAAHAVSQSMILVTSNTREFERVRGLRVEDWR